MKKILFAAAALALNSAAQIRAETAPPPKLTRVEGVVTKISSTEVTLAETGGKVETIALVPDWLVLVSKRISVNEIKPGSYLGTTNTAKPDGTGRSIEVHVSPPGARGPGLDFVMDAATNTTMTNGVVGTVAKTSGGRLLDVNYGFGDRHITVPPGIPVVLNVPGGHELVKIGHTIRVTTFTPPTGSPVRQFITVGTHGAPPPG
jgi:hypothetical protein